MTSYSRPNVIVEYGLLVATGLAALFLSATVANYIYTDYYYSGNVPNEGGAGFAANIFLLLLSTASAVLGFVGLVYLAAITFLKRGAPRSWMRYTSYALLLPFLILLGRIAYVAITR